MVGPRDEVELSAVRPVALPMLMALCPDRHAEEPTDGSVAREVLDELAAAPYPLATTTD